MWARFSGAVLLALLAGGCASSVFQEYPGKAHGYDKGAESELDEAVALAANRRYAEAAAEFERLAEEYRQDQDYHRAALATFWLGFCLEKQGRIEEAEEIYEQVSLEYGDTPAAARARQRLDMLDRDD